MFLSKKGLTIVLWLYGIILTVNFFQHLNSKRLIDIEKYQLGGYVIIGSVKHIVPYRLEKVSLPYSSASITDYLLLANTQFGDNLIESFIEIILLLLLGLLIWNMDFYEPFQYKFYKKARLIAQLCVILIILKCIKVMYAANWVSTHLHDERNFQYRSEKPNWWWYLIMIYIIATLLRFYNKAVKNQEEIDLTI